MYLRSLAGAGSAGVTTATKSTATAIVLILQRQTAPVPERHRAIYLCPALLSESVRLDEKGLEEVIDTHLSR